VKEKADAGCKTDAEVQQTKQDAVKAETSAANDDSDDENKNEKLLTPSSTTWVEVAETSS
jgi:hypothetical protein